MEDYLLVNKTIICKEISWLLYRREKNSFYSSIIRGRLLTFYVFGIFFLYGYFNINKVFFLCLHIEQNKFY